MTPLRILAAVGLLAAPLSSRADEAPVPAAQHSVSLAISRVYPALVQIHVLALDYSSGRERKYGASGSGIIISESGYVVTNHHVAGKAASIRVTLSSREQLDATLVGTDALADIAVLKLDLSKRRAGAGPLPSAKFGASSALRVGDPVLAMGCPLALSHSVTQGIVANKDMMLPRPLGERFLLDGEDVGTLVKWVGHDAAIAPGNSGGPLVNLDGEVVGINEVGIGPISGAIPSELARAVADELIAHGKVRRAFIGADFQPLLTRDTDGDPELRGVLVAGVLDGTAAATAGLRAGDVVTAVDGAKVSARFREELPAFNLLLLGKPVGRPIELSVRRGGKLVPVRIGTELRQDASGLQVDAKEWGLSLEWITTLAARELQLADAHGALVRMVRSGGASDRAVPPLQAGDVIAMVAGKKVADVDGLLALTKELTAGKKEPVPTVVTIKRRTEELLTVVEVGIRQPPDSPEETRKAWLPVATQVLTKKLATALKLKGKSGVRITQVYPGGSAEKAGFLVGDVITHIDGNAVEASEPHDADVFDSMVHAYRLGAKAEFTVLREGKPMPLSAVLDEGFKPEREMKIYEDAQLEFRARDVSDFDRVRRRWGPKDSGAIVTQVENGGWAAVGGLHLDDVILAVDDAPVATVEDLKPRLEGLQERKAARVVFLVRRGMHTLFLELEPKWR